MRELSRGKCWRSAVEESWRTAGEGFSR
ncbi:hypothetical protein RND81_12G092500 [Saponaria officinalis]|uniref:Uncharacterized protein n=1 Tax=Saponaria officinalis TaxID=3572 RepID=A0AAW1H8F7_SAPOF